MAEDTEDRMPALDTAIGWLKIMVVFAGLIAINVVAFLVSFGAGVIITLPLTFFMGFLLMRDMLPRHRFPTGRPKRTVVP